MAEAKNWVLTDAAARVWVESIEIGPADLGLAEEGWSIRKTTLRGGPGDGVDLIEVDNGALSFSLLPTRGMGIWKGSYKGLDVGWDSPVKGPVHPSLIDLQDRGGWAGSLVSTNSLSAAVWTRPGPRERTWCPIIWGCRRRWH